MATPSSPKNPFTDDAFVRDFMTVLPLKELGNMCQTNSDAMHICKTEAFWFDRLTLLLGTAGQKSSNLLGQLLYKEFRNTGESVVGFYQRLKSGLSVPKSMITAKNYVDLGKRKLKIDNIILKSNNLNAVFKEMENCGNKVVGVVDAARGVVVLYFPVLFC